MLTHPYPSQEGRAVKFSVESTSQVASTWYVILVFAHMEATLKVDSMMNFENLTALLPGGE